MSTSGAVIICLYNKAANQGERGCPHCSRAIVVNKVHNSLRSADCLHCCRWNPIRREVENERYHSGKHGWLSTRKLSKTANELKNNSYGHCLLCLIGEQKASDVFKVLD